MRPITYHKKDLIELVVKKKIITMQQLIHETGCSSSTALRHLKAHKHGYLTSYNFNAKYYTLADIPEFDQYGLWTFKDVRFSKYGSLTNTITQLIANSPKGLQIDEIEKILSVDVAPIVTKLFQKKSINRERVRGVLFYFNHSNDQMQTQLKKRQDEIREKISILLPEPERIIAVLVDVILNPRSQTFEIYQRLSTKGINISQDEINAIFLYYNLKKKKTLEILKLRAEIINKTEAPLPDHCILPPNYTLEVSSHRQTCINPQCQEQQLRIQRTVWRHPIGIMLGQSIVKHQIKKCPLCKQEYPFEQLHHLIPPHGNYAYDIIIYVGVQRFRHHRQNLEIQQQLLHRFKLAIPESTINELAHKFIDYFSALHYAKVNDIAQFIQSNGGYVAHFDGTCEAGTSVLFSGIDEISGIVLLTARMPSENIGEIKKFFTECKNLYDQPLAIMRDLSTNYQPAIKKIFQESVDLICQYHFLENVGKALLKETHQQLTNSIRQLKVKSSFKSIRKKLVQTAYDHPSVSSKQLQQFIEKNGVDINHNLNLNLNLNLDKDKNVLQKHLTYFILRWLDDYYSELKGEYFPFDQPALAYYRRCIQIYDLLQLLLDDSSEVKTKKKMTLLSIVRNLEPLKNDEKIQQIANRLEKQVNLFNQLRDILRFNRTDKKPICRKKSPRTVNIKEMKETAEKLEQFRQDLHEKTKSKQTDHDIKGFKKNCLLSG